MRRKRTGVIVAISILVLIMVFLVIAGGIKNSMPHLTPEQLVVYEDELDKGVRVDGFVVENSIEYDMATLRLAFAIRGLDRKIKVNVLAHIVKPDAFEEGKGVIIEGIYDKERNLILASKILTKCPSKYESDLNAEL